MNVGEVDFADIMFAGHICVPKIFGIEMCPADENLQAWVFTELLELYCYEIRYFPCFNSNVIRV